MSNTGLVFQEADPQAAHGLCDQIVKLVGIGASAGEGDALAAIDGVSLSVLVHECLIAGLLNSLGDLFKCIVPGNIFPLRSARSAHLWLQQPAVIQDVLFERGALGAKSAAVDRMSGVSLYVDDLGGNVLCLIAVRVDDHAATARTVRTCGASLGGQR